MTVKEKILQCFEGNSGADRNGFTLNDIISHFDKNRIPYNRNTISTHISSRMCKDSPKNHNVKYNYFTRLSRGIYSY